MNRKRLNKNIDHHGEGCLSVAPAERSTQPRLKLPDPLAYLLGSRRAIQRLESSRGVIWLGLALVLTAGIARHYDHTSLWSDFRWLYGPIVVSLISSLIIFGVVFAGLRLGKSHGSFWTQYRGFLGLFWLTAPIAWVYAVPVERWGDPLLAAKWNLLFLGVVSVWRVLLISRAVSVTKGKPFGLALLFVLIPASLEMAAATFLLRLDYNVVSTMATAEARPDVQLMNLAAQTVHSASLVVLGVALAIAGFRLVRPRIGWV